MVTFIHVTALEKMRSKNIWSFYIVELASEHHKEDLIVDVVESEEEALAKCKYANEIHGIKCKYYETGVDTFELILEITKGADTSGSSGSMIGIPGLELRRVE